MTTRYLSNAEVNLIADAICSSYEISCQWSRGLEEGRDFAAENFGFVPRKSVMFLALKIAKVKWQGITISVKREIADCA